MNSAPVIRHARSEWVEECLRRLEYLERKYNEGKTDVPMRIAYGYAIFDEQYDKNMEETRNRADVKMYEKKRAIKAEERKWKKMREFPHFFCCSQKLLPFQPQLSVGKYAT